MSKMIIEIQGISKEQLRDIAGKKFEAEFKKIPLLKNYVKINYED